MTQKFEINCTVNGTLVWIYVDMTILESDWSENFEKLSITTVIPAVWFILMLFSSLYVSIALVTTNTETCAAVVPHKK